MCLSQSQTVRHCVLLYPCPVRGWQCGCMHPQALPYTCLSSCDAWLVVYGYWLPFLSLAGCGAWVWWLLKVHGYHCRSVLACVRCALSTGGFLVEPSRVPVQGARGLVLHLAWNSIDSSTPLVTVALHYRTALRRPYHSAVIALGIAPALRTGSCYRHL